MSPILSVPGAGTSRRQCIFDRDVPIGRLDVLDGCLLNFSPHIMLSDDDPTARFGHFRLLIVLYGFSSGHYSALQRILDERQQRKSDV